MKFLERLSKSPKFLVVCIICFVIVFAVFAFNLDKFSQKSSLDLKTFSIEVLSDEQIVKVINCNSILSSTQYKNNTSTGVPNTSKTVDSDEIKFSCKEITGISEVSATKAKDCTLTLNISSELVSGKAEIVVIRDELILERLDFNETKQLSYYVTGEHIFVVKILCERAELSISVSRSFD